MPGQPQELQWGTRYCMATRLMPQPAPGSIQRIGTGADVERSARPGLTAVAYTDLSGGLRTLSGVQNWTRDLNQLFSNDGLQTRLPGLCILPEAPTVQASITSDVDISGYVALNRRRHDLATSLGDTASRLLIGLGPLIYGDTSASNGALLVRNTRTDMCISSGILKLNNIFYASFSWRGQTDDTRGTTDVSGSGALALTELITHAAANDGFYAMQYLPEHRVNILCGQYNGTVGWWYIPDDAAIPATPQPLVFSATKDINGSIATVTTGPVSPIASSQAYDVTVADINTQVWTTPGNVLASDDADATTGGNIAAGAESMALQVSFQGQLTAVPPANIILGVLVETEGSESNADDNMRLTSVRLMLAGAVTGHNRATQTEFGTVDAYQSFGASTDAFGLSMTGATVQSLGVEIKANHSGGTSPLLSLDHVRVTITHRPPGVQMPAFTGGSGCVPSLTNPNRVAYREPAANNPTAITQPYRLVFNDITWDAAGNRPVGAFTYPNVGQGLTVHNMCPFQGGYQVIVHSVTGPGIMVKLIDSQNQTRNMNVPAVHGTTAVRFESLYAQADWSIIDVVNSDYSDRQWWYWNASRSYPDTLRQSLSGTSIALEPIPCAEGYLSPQQNLVYCIYPRGTRTAVTRVYVPPSLSADPRINNTSQVKAQATVSSSEDTPAYAIGVELNFGPEEANKAIMQAIYQGRSISSTSTVQFGFNVIGSGVVTSPAGSNTFTAAYTTYNVLSSGVAYRTFQPWWGLSHTAASANTPNGLNILVYSAQEFIEETQYSFEVRPESLRPDVWSWIDDTRTLKNSKSVQTLTYANLGDGVGVPTTLEWAWGRAGLAAAPRGSIQVTDDFKDANGNPVSMYLTFTQRPGTAATS